MTRLIYSIYQDKVDPHKSASPYKQAQFVRYRHHIKIAQENWAKKCNADYILITPETHHYDDINFTKIRLFEQYSEEYDEVVYIDFDIVPFSGENIFEHLDFNIIHAHKLERDWTTLGTKHRDLSWHINNDTFDKMNVYVKTCAKRAMLELEDIQGDHTLVNTGVLAGNRHAIAKLKFREREQECFDKLKEAIDDNLYPEEIHSKWWPNNEIFFSYIIEKYDVPLKHLPESWNFILDRMHPHLPEKAHLLHHVNKEFYRSFDDEQMSREEIKQWLLTHRGRRNETVTMDITNKCTLECPKCMRQWNRKKGIKAGGINSKDISVENWKKLHTFFKGSSLCGQMSDPILYPHLEEILKHHWWCDLKCTIHTAATPKHITNGQYLRFFKANPKAKWIFGIDGLPEQSHKYRIGQDGVRLFELMLIAKNEGLEVEWQYIVFSYNEDSIEEAMKIADANGIKLVLNISSRFKKKGYDPLRPKNEIFNYANIIGTGYLT